MTIFESVYQALLDQYGPQGWWPLVDRSSHPLKCLYIPQNTTRDKTSHECFEICVGAILTQNTSWSNAEKALVSLIQAKALSPEILSQSDTSTIAGLITSSGYYNQKAKKLKSFSAFFLTHPKPERQLFLSNWGLGPETVDDMLLYAYDQPVFVVDLYTKRLFSRLGVCSEGIDYHDLQAMITQGIEKDVTLYKEYHALIVHHAKKHCRKSPHCVSCPLASICPRVNVSTPSLRSQKTTKGAV